MIPKRVTHFECLFTQKYASDPQIENPLIAGGATDYGTSHDAKDQPGNWEQTFNDILLAFHSKHYKHT